MPINTLGNILNKKRNYFMSNKTSIKFKKDLERLYSESPEKIKLRLDRLMLKTVIEQLNNLETSGKIDKTLEYLIKSGMTEEEILKEIK